MVLNGRNLARYKLQLAVSLGLLIILSFFPHLARANPFVGDTYSSSCLYNPIPFYLDPCVGLFLAYLLTAVIEVPTVLLAGKYLFRFSGLRAWRWLWVGLGVNLITLPFAWVLVLAIYAKQYAFGSVDYRPAVNPASYSLIMAIVEGVVVLLEAEIYHRFVLVKRQHALALSLIANALSYSVGLALF